MSKKKKDKGILEWAEKILGNAFKILDDKTDECKCKECKCKEK